MKRLLRSLRYGYDWRGIGCGRFDLSPFEKKKKQWVTKQIAIEARVYTPVHYTGGRADASCDMED